MKAYFDLEAVKNWYDSQTNTYQNKPSCLKVQFYQKVGTKTEVRETKNYDGDDLVSLSEGDNNSIACQRFTPSSGWYWLQNTINSFIPSGTEKLMISYYTSNGSAKSSFPISLNRKQDIVSFNNIGGLSGQKNQNLVEVIAGLMQQNTSIKSEAELRAEILKDVQRDRRIEDLEDHIEYLKEEQLGGLKKIGAILDGSPEIAKGVGAGIQMLFGVIGQHIGKFANNLANNQQSATAAVGTLDTDKKETVIITIDVAMAAVEKEFPNENPIITIYKLAKVLEQNPMFKPMIQAKLKEIEL